MPKMNRWRQSWDLLFLAFLLSTQMSVYTAIGTTSILSLPPQAIGYGIFLFVITGILFWKGVKPRPLGANLLIDWLPFLGLLLVYGNMRTLEMDRLSLALGIHPKDALILQGDEWFFGKGLFSYFKSFQTGLLGIILGIFYFGLYYLQPAGILIWFYWIRRDLNQFLILRQGILLCLLGGYVFYVLIPVAGPLPFLGKDLFATDCAPLAKIKSDFDLLRYRWDCFPSLHVALPVLLVPLCWNRGGLLYRGMLISVAIGVSLSTLVFCYHYGMDVVAGILWAIASAGVVLRGQLESK